MKNNLIFLLLFIIVASPAFAQNNKNIHEGVASCASGVCHGQANTHPNANIQHNEYYLWSSHDAHAKAFTALNSTLGQAIAKGAGLANASTAKECLVCHTDFIAKPLRGRRFSLEDGVGCETCHGGAQKWLSDHYSETASHARNISNGMTPLEDTQVRARICLTCHVGDKNHFVSHTMMAAGHPRLRFELDTYVAIQPPHFSIDADYKKRKKVNSASEQWAHGQIQTARNTLEILQTQLNAQLPLFPDWAVFDCFSCHRAISKRPFNSHVTPPQNNEIALPYTAFELTALMAKSLNHKHTSSFQTQLEVEYSHFRKTGHFNSQQLMQIDVGLQSLQSSLAKPLSNTEKKSLLKNLLEFKKCDSFLLGEQITMGIEVLLIDLGLRDFAAKPLEQLVKTLEYPEYFEAVNFVNTLANLKQHLKTKLH